MTKADIAYELHKKVGFSKKDSIHYVESFLEIMKEQLENGENIKLSGFGNFEVRKKRNRRGRNPHTGAPLEISERKVLIFKASPVLKEVVDGSGS